MPDSSRNQTAPAAPTVAQIEDECENLRVALEDAERKLEVLIEDAERERSRADAEHGRAESLRAERDALATTLSAAQQRTEELDGLGTALEQHEEELQVAYEELETTVEELRQANDQLELNREGLEAEVESRTLDLKQAERHLRTIIDTIPDPIITIDEGGTIRSFSPAAEGLFGFAAGETVGQNVSMLMPPPYRDEHDGYLARYRDTGEKRIIGTGRVVFGRKKDGATFPMELAVGEFTLDADRVFVGVIRDVSRREEAEREIHQLQAELLEASRLTGLGEMASALAHELNQPLSAVVGYLDAGRTLLGAQAPERVLELMRKSSDQARRAGDIVHRMKDLAQKGRTDHRVAKLATVLEEAAALAAIGVPQRDVSVTVELSSDLPDVLVDATQIQQVVLNLVRNGAEALDGRPDGQIRIATETVDDGFVTVMVSDNGPGLALEVAERLFRPFVTTKATGTGIGLSICRSIVESHGGRIWVESASDAGTAFHFTVPVATG
jgi:two-component system sensor kinase FixL